MFHSPRNTTPPRKVLEEDEESTRKDLEMVILQTTCGVDRSDATAVNMTAHALKSACLKFEDSSRDLCSWLKKHGHTHEALCVRTRRHKLIYIEAKESLEDLNNILSELDNDTISGLGAPSESSFHSSSHLEDRMEDSRVPAAAGFTKVQERDMGESYPMVKHQALNEKPFIHVVKLDSRELVSTINSSVAALSDPLPATQSVRPKIFLPTSTSPLPVCSGGGNQYTSSMLQTFVRQRPITHPIVTMPYSNYVKPTLTPVVTLGNNLMPPSVAHLDRLDMHTRHVMKQELLKGGTNKFCGDPQHFISWRINLQRRIQECEADSLDAIHIILANTGERPRAMVLSFLSAGISDPDSALTDIWQNLQYRFGTPERTSESLICKLENFKAIRNPNDLLKLEDMLDLCKIIYSTMSSCRELTIFNLRHGMKSVWEKLPDQFQSRWRSRYMRHEEETGCAPDFGLFIESLEKYVKEMSHPSFSSGNINSRAPYPKNVRALVTSTDVEISPEITCVYHDKPGHSITTCRTFSKLSDEDRKKFVWENKLCFCCLGNHFAQKCPNRLTIRCVKCNKPHNTLMHFESKHRNPDRRSDRVQSGYAVRPADSLGNHVRNSCIQLCRSVQSNRVCSKTLLVDIAVEGSDKSMRCLCVIDEQSEATFCDPCVVSYFGINGCKADYSLTTMNSSSVYSGELLSNLLVKGVNCSKWYKIPKLFTHPNLPDTKRGIASRDIVSAHRHISRFAKHFPDVDNSLQVVILVGADTGELMETKCYGAHYPFVHRTPLGYSLVGPACLSGGDLTDHELKFNTLRTSVDVESVEPKSVEMLFTVKNHINVDPFVARLDDEIPGHSQEDSRFIRLMEAGVTVTKEGNIQLPLPIRPDIALPDNRLAVFYRTKNTLERLKRNVDRMQMCIDSFGSYLQSGHVVQVNPADKVSNNPFYIPILPVIDNVKNKARLVFDSSAKFEGCSLNDALMQGPDRNNSLLGVLVRFRLGEVAINADIEKMFHAFFVDPEHTDLLRFFWFSKNDPSNPIVEFKALVHIFGNKPSPAIANFGLRYASLHVDEEAHPDVVTFIDKHFYVDDALYSTDHVNDAISILKGARDVLSKFNIRLHKLRSSHDEVLGSFPIEELAESTEVTELASNNGECKTLGVAWNPKLDIISLSPRVAERPFTRRGMLAVINSIYDPIGLASPIVLRGRLLQRQIILSKPAQVQMNENIDWDDPLPRQYMDAWIKFNDSLREVDELRIPRCYKPSGFGSPILRELHCFSDASDEAIGFVIYLRQTSKTGETAVSFVFASSRVAPRAATTIPRLELCAAMEAARGMSRMSMELCVDITGKYLYTDSKIVMGYLQNSSKRFPRYVSRRIDETLKYSSVEEWSHIAGAENIGDVASRPQTKQSLVQSNWLRGPAFLMEVHLDLPLERDDSPMSLSSLPEFKCAQVTYEGTSESDNVICRIITITNSYSIARSILAHMIKFIHLCRGCLKHPGLCEICNVSLNTASSYFIKYAQSVFYSEIQFIREGKLSLSDPLSNLSPFLDKNDFLRVGGRLRDSRFPGDVKHPILLPTDHPVTLMILSDCHAAVHHQGRHITMGHLRQSGYHILKCSSLVKKFIASCVICRKLRGKVQEQYMADLPSDRMEEVPPFTNVGLDLFGPYSVHDGKTTRKQTSSKKVWGLLLTCLVSRAVHVELLPYLDTPSLQLGLRRFYAIRGTCRRIRSDQGSNIIGARSQLIDLVPLRDDARSHGVTWELIPPGASSWGGVWERKVGAIKKVLDATLTECCRNSLSRDELNTLLQECASIVNNTPLWECSSHPDDPAPLSPASLLTLREHPNPPPPERFDERDIHSYGIRRWRRVMYLSEQFWDRWHRNYLQCLQKRNKWKCPNTSVNVGDIVLVKGPTKRNEWSMGRIVRIRCGRDQLPRSVTLKIPGRGCSSDRLLERCIRDTVLLVSSDSPECKTSSLNSKAGVL